MALIAAENIPMLRCLLQTDGLIDAHRQWVKLIREKERAREREGREALWYTVTYRHTDKCNPQQEWHRCLHSGRGRCCSCPWSGCMNLQCSLAKKTITVDESVRRKRQSLWMIVYGEKDNHCGWECTGEKDNHCGWECTGEKDNHCGWVLFFQNMNPA